MSKIMLRERSQEMPSVVLVRKMREIFSWDNNPQFYYYYRNMDSSSLEVFVDCKHYGAKPPQWLYRFELYKKGSNFKLMTLRLDEAYLGEVLEVSDADTVIVGKKREQVAACFAEEVLRKTMLGEEWIVKNSIQKNKCLAQKDRLKSSLIIQARVYFDKENF